MKIEILSIASEVLSGSTVNTNASFLSTELIKAGFAVSRHGVIPDDAKAITQELQTALERSAIVITTGGLGPTCDDLTKDIAADLFNSPLEFNGEIAADIEKRYGKISSIVNQATVPTKARILSNEVGTAPGFIFQQFVGHEPKALILLPGVPEEMKAMFINEALPFLRSQYAEFAINKVKTLYLFSTPENAVDPLLRTLQKEYPEIQFGIYPGKGTLQIDCYAKDPNHYEVISIVLDKISKAFQEKIYFSSTGKLEQAVHDFFTEKKWTLAAAESCTGGYFSSVLTRLPGASLYFQGAIVAYSNQLKNSLLGIPQAVLETHGAVSMECVSAMLKGIFDTVNCDFAVAITGIAGPSGGSLEKPVGTIWCAVGRRNKEERIWQIKAHGNRSMIIEKSTNALLGGLLDYARSE